MTEPDLKSLIFELLSELGVGHSEESKWLRAVNQIFDDAKQTSFIYRSEIESLIIGLRTNVKTEEGRKILQKLLSVESLMRSRGINKLKINKNVGLQESTKQDAIYEGVSVFVPDVTERRLNTILDLCFFLQDKVLIPIIEKQFTEQEKETYKQIGLKGETFAPDGDSFDKDSGTINFYISGIPNRLMNVFLNAIKYYLTDEGIEIGPFKGPEQSGTYKSQVIRIPVLKTPEQDMPPDLSITYRTARAIFKDLLSFNDASLDEDEPSFTVPAKELLRRIEMVEDNDFKIQSLVTPDKTEKGGRGATIHHFGLKEEWIRNILKTLKDIAEWAIKGDYTNVAVN